MLIVTNTRTTLGILVLLVILLYFSIYIGRLNDFQSLYHNVIYPAVTYNNLIDESVYYRSHPRPNILLLFPDQWRFDWIDNYYLRSLSLNIPTIRRMIANSTRFVNTIVAAPTCVPSRACLAAGKEYDDTGILSNNKDWYPNKKTFYKLMQENGYWTMTTGKDDLTKQHGVGIDGKYRLDNIGFNDGRRCKGKLDLNGKYPKVTDPFSQYLSQNTYNDTTYFNIMHQCFSKCRKLVDCSVPCNIDGMDEMIYHDHWITQQTLDILDNKPKSIPWFLQVNYAGPHDPFLITTEMYKSVEQRVFPTPKQYSELVNTTAIRSNINESRKQYSAQIEYLDKEFEIIINKLHEMNEYGNTIICLSSDHGDMLGDSDDFGKFKPWIQSINVPLICSGPNIIKKQIINKYVTLIDLAATFLDYSNTTKPEEMTSVSLRPFLNGTWNDEDNDYREYVLSGLDRWRVAIKEVNATHTFKFICCTPSNKCGDRRFVKYTFNGTSQLLYNTKSDLYEQNNIAALYPNVVKEMKRLLPNSWCDS